MGVRCNGFKENQTSKKVGFVTLFLAWFQVEHPFCERLERDRKMWHIGIILFTTKHALLDLILVNCCRRYSENPEKSTKKKYVIGLKF